MRDYKENAIRANLSAANDKMVDFIYTLLMESLCQQAAESEQDDQQEVC